MKKLLYIIPYLEIFPPKNGGMLRNYFLCFELSKYFKVTIVTFQAASKFIDGVNGYQWDESVSIITIPVNNPTDLMQKIKNGIKGRIYQRKIFKSAENYSLFAYPVLKKILKDNEFDYIIFPHLWTLSLIYLIKKYANRSIIYFDAHNVEHLLYSQDKDLLDKTILKKYEQIKREESLLHKKVDYFFACSKNDLKILEQLNNNYIKGFLIPNGADIYRNEYCINKKYEKRIIFCGSLDYEPNIDGLLWFYNEMWQNLKILLPGLRFTIIGRNAKSEDLEILRSDVDIDFIGEVEDVKDYYYKSWVSIVPLRMGSGTRLKILEAMSLGTVIVSTSIGADGINCNHNQQIYLADTPDEFIKGIVELFSNQKKARLLSRNARELIDFDYSWPSIGRELAKVINQNTKNVN